MSEELLNEEEKELNDNEQIKQFNKEVLGRLDSPLVVHKKGDASYEENTAAFEMNETHTDEERPTLVRHRFRRDKKSHKGVTALVIIAVIVLGVFAGLYLTGNIKFNNGEDTSSTAPAKSKASVTDTTALEDKFKDTIVIKDMFIFVDGKEVNGIQGLQDALKYEDPSPTKYKIIIEHANSDFLNGEVYRRLEDMGFYSSDTEISTVENTGLIAYAETTTLPPETTTKKKNKKNKKNKKKNKKNKKKQG